MNGFEMPNPEHNSDGFWISSPRITSKMFKPSPRKNRNYMSIQIDLQFFTSKFPLKGDDKQK